MRDGLVAWRWAGRALLGLVILVMYAPVGMVFVYSFNASEVGSAWTGFSTRWYPTLWQRADLWEGLRNSLFVGIGASTLSVVLGTLAAVGLRRWRPRPQRLGSGLLGLPLVVPDMMMAVSLALFFHALGDNRGLGTVVLAHTAFGVSYAFVVMAAAVGDLDESLYAAALDCGATPWQAFRHVVLPLLAPSITVAWLLVFALSFDDFLITFFTKGPGQDTLPIRIESQMRFGVRPSTNALFVVLFLASLTGAIVVRRLSRRRILRPQSTHAPVGRMSEKKITTESKRI